MGASLQHGQSSGRGGRRRGRRRAPMAEINVTPFVDVMLVLLIIFMVAAPLLTVGVPVDLPKSEGKTLPSTDTAPITVSVDGQSRIFIQNAEIPLDEVQPKLAAITTARNGLDETIFVRGDKSTNYGELMRVMGRIASAGYKKVSLVTEFEDKR